MLLAHNCTCCIDARAVSNDRRPSAHSPNNDLIGLVSDSSHLRQAPPTATRFIVEYWPSLYRCVKVCLPKRDHAHFVDPPAKPLIPLLPLPLPLSYCPILVQPSGPPPMPASTPTAPPLPHALHRVAQHRAHTTHALHIPHPQLTPASPRPTPTPPHSAKLHPIRPTLPCPNPTPSPPEPLHIRPTLLPPAARAGRGLQFLFFFQLQP